MPSKANSPFTLFMDERVAYGPCMLLAVDLFIRENWKDTLQHFLWIHHFPYREHRIATNSHTPYINVSNKSMFRQRVIKSFNTPLQWLIKPNKRGALTSIQHCTIPNKGSDDCTSIPSPLQFSPLPFPFLTPTAGIKS